MDDDELVGQLPLFEIGDAVIVNTYTGDGELINKQTYQDFVPWQELVEAED